MVVCTRFPIQSCSKYSYVYTYLWSNGKAINVDQKLSRLFHTTNGGKLKLMTLHNMYNNKKFEHLTKYGFGYSEETLNRRERAKKKLKS